MSATEAAVGPTDVVLEIGCGAGRVGRHLAPHCARWIGADVSVNMIRFAEEGLGDHRNVSFVKLNGFDLTGVETAHSTSCIARACSCTSTNGSATATSSRPDGF